MGYALLFLSRAEPDAHFARRAVVPRGVGDGDHVQRCHAGGLVATVERLVDVYKRQSTVKPRRQFEKGKIDHGFGGSGECARIKICVNPSDPRHPRSILPGSLCVAEPDAHLARRAVVPRGVGVKESLWLVTAAADRLRLIPAGCLQPGSKP